MYEQAHELLFTLVHFLELLKSRALLPKTVSLLARVTTCLALTPHPVPPISVPPLAQHPWELFTNYPARSSLKSSKPLQGRPLADTTQSPPLSNHRGAHTKIFHSYNFAGFKSSLPACISRIFFFSLLKKFCRCWHFSHAISFLL